MSLLKKIQSTLALPDQKPIQAPPAPEPDNIVDIDQRDQFISACLQCSSDPVAQLAIYHHIGMNRATLHAAVKILCKATDSEALQRYGGNNSEVVMKTGKEWAEGSVHTNRKKEKV